mmetsp:Transcript_37980/g.64911  ORF Transcript_37980/g.64911 Transcript_37980/m.64911 type:complete len:200 (-) Transcript_37980:333-932(-)
MLWTILVRWRRRRRFGIIILSTHHGDTDPGTNHTHDRPNNGNYGNDLIAEYFGILRSFSLSCCSYGCDDSLDVAVGIGTNVGVDIAVDHSVKAVGIVARGGSVRIASSATETRLSTVTRLTIETCRHRRGSARHAILIRVTSSSPATAARTGFSRPCKRPSQVSKTASPVDVGPKGRLSLRRSPLVGLGEWVVYIVGFG